MTIIETVRNYVENLDCMNIFENAVNVNFLNSETDSFSIEEIPTKPIVKKYIDGSSKRQFEFAFCSREPYGLEILQNIDNSNFYEEFSNEIERKNSEGSLPLMSNNLEPIELEITSSAYVVSVTEDTGMYQVNLRLKYIKKEG